MILKHFIKSIFNWEKRLSKMNNDSLFALFSETQRTNLKPQLYAGNVLYERGYNTERLIQTKSELITAIEVAFEKKYFKEPFKIKLENLIGKILWRSLSTTPLLFYYNYYNHIPLLGNGFEMYQINLILIAIILFPLINIRRTNQKAMEKLEIKKQQKEDQVILLYEV